MCCVISGRSRREKTATSPCVRFPSVEPSHLPGPYDFPPQIPCSPWSLLPLLPACPASLLLLCSLTPAVGGSLARSFFLTTTTTTAQKVILLSMSFQINPSSAAMRSAVQKALLGHDEIENAMYGTAFLLRQDGARDEGKNAQVFQWISNGFEDSGVINSLLLPDRNQHTLSHAHTSLHAHTFTLLRMTRMIRFNLVDLIRFDANQRALRSDVTTLSRRMISTRSPLIRPVFQTGTLLAPLAPLPPNSEESLRLLQLLR